MVITKHTSGAGGGRATLLGVAALLAVAAGIAGAAWATAPGRPGWWEAIAPAGIAFGLDYCTAADRCSSNRRGLAIGRGERPDHPPLSGNRLALGGPDLAA